MVCGAAFVGSMLKEATELRDVAVADISSNQECIEKLGDNIAGLMPTNMNSNTNNGVKTASCNFAVTGSAGSGNVFVEGTKVGGAWNITTLDVTFGDGSSLSLR